MEDLRRRVHAGGMMTRMSDEAPWEPEPIVMPITDELDLHTFRPKECGPVVRDWLHEARDAGFTRVRIVHGKGIGVIRKTVHKELERHPLVVRFELAGQGHGGWGATIVWLRADEEE